MLQIVEQTREEKVAMYMKLPKEQIVEMLLANQDIIEKMSGQKPFLHMLTAPTKEDIKRMRVPTYTIIA